MKRIALIFLALQLISSVVCVYFCKLAFASAIDRIFREIFGNGNGLQNVHAVHTEPEKPDKNK